MLTSTREVGKVGVSPKQSLVSLDPFVRERDGLAALLASGEFSRSPNLEKILVYLCEKYFRGESASIKEYHLAIEVLGRPESFDPKRDSIVRVELHRLRRRLREAAARAPAHAVRILLPEKSYTPEFLLPTPAEAGTESPEPVTALAPLPATAVMDVELLPATAVPAPPSALEAPASRLPRWLAAVGLLTASAALLLWYNGKPAPVVEPAATAAAPEPAAAPPVGEQVRILCGRPTSRHVDSAGRTWDGDRYFTGGEAVATQGDIRTIGFDHDLFAGYREGEFQYDIPLKPGSYEATLLFAETQYGENSPMGGGEAYRIFSIHANGQVLVSDFDVMAQTMESHTATARRFRGLQPAQDGKLHLKFTGNGSGKPFVNAIIIEPGLPHAARPLRMVARAKSFRDDRQVTWEPDHFYRGGVQITRPHGAPTLNGDIFRGERYGRFAYSIPVPAGRYTAKLYFWEYWWGPGNPGKGGAGSRLFDVFCNHRPLLTDFDVFRTNPDKHFTVQTFRGLEPDAQGQLVFDFVPKRNYAMLNALEILDEAQ